jgi:hypothetical protein
LSFFALLIDATGLVGSIRDGLTQGNMSSKLMRPLSWSSFSSTAVGLYLRRQFTISNRILYHVSVYDVLYCVCVYPYVGPS